MSYFNKTQTNLKNKNNILNQKKGRAVNAFVDTWKRSRGSIADGVRDPACILCASQENLHARILAAAARVNPGFDIRCSRTRACRASPGEKSAQACPDRRFPQLTTTASYLAISDAAAICSGNGSEGTRGQQLCQYHKSCIVQRAEWAEDR